MKKFMMFALCVAAVGSMSAQKTNVDAAKKLSGKVDKIGEARTLIDQAIQNPETAKDASTYFIGGKIEFDAYDKGFQAGLINPEDPIADKAKMAEELLRGYDLFVQAVPFDQVPNEKGEVKPKHTKDIVNKIAGHAKDFFDVGANLWELKNYPEAYKSLLIYADMPDMELLGNKAPKIPDIDRARAYYFAGLSAYYMDKLVDAAEALKKSQTHGFNDSTAYTYEMLCWQTLVQKDSTMQSTAKERIFETAKAGHQKYGLKMPIFLNNIVNYYVVDDKYDEALAILNENLATNPDDTNILRFRAYVYDRMGNDDASISDYLTAAQLPNCNADVLKDAARKLYRTAANKLGTLDPRDSEGKQNIRTQYLVPGLEMAKKAQTMQADDYDIKNIIDAFEYSLETYY